MANAAVAFINLADADAAVISASDYVLLAPPSRLADPQVGVKWRDNATTTHVLVNLGSSQSIDTVMMAGVNGLVPTFRVRYSSVDSTGLAGDIYDSTGVTGLPYFDPDYGLFVCLKSAPASAQFVRIDITSTGVDYIEAGRLFVGLRNAFGINYQTPWTRTPVRGSVDIFSVQGATFTDLRRGHWVVNSSFTFLTVAEREGFIEDIATAIINTGHTDMLWIKDTASSNLSRDSVWGYLAGDLAVTQNQYLEPAIFSAEFQVRERL